MSHVNIDELINITNKYYNTINVVIDNKLITINKSGYINTVKKWYINAYIDTDFNDTIN